jgi:hypothetical protein
MFDPDSARDASAWMAEARARQKLISENMPEGVDPRALTWASKTPYVAMCFREAQFCRAEEFARAACDMFERNDVVVGVANTRAMIESVVAIWFLNEKIKRQITNGLESNIHEQVVQLLMGFKNEATFPPAINILTVIDKFDKEVPGFRAQYDRLSEFAHPNYSGALGAFGTRDEEVAITWFRKGEGANKDAAKRIGVGNLVPALAILEIVFNETAELMPDFCKLFEEAPKKG